MRALTAMALVAALAGCPSDDGSGPPDSFFEGEPEIVLEVGHTADGTFTRWAPGDVVSWVWGPQGGTMITPTLRLPLGTAEDGSWLEVALTQQPDPGFPDDAGELADFPGLEEPFQFYERDGVLRATDIPSQLGWGDPSGARMLLGATVRGEDFAASFEPMPLQVDSTGAANSCDQLPRETIDGCLYAVMEGEGMFGWTSPSEAPGSCQDPVELWFEWWANDSDFSHCGSKEGRLTMPDGQDVPEACLDAIGYSSFETFSATTKVRLEGDGCPYALWEADVDLTPCQAYCQ